MQRANSLEKTLMLGKIEGRQELRVAEDEIVGWHHQLNGHELEQSLGDSEGQGSLVFSIPWAHKELDMTERPNNNMFGYGPSMLKTCVISLSLSSCFSLSFCLCLSLSVLHTHIHPHWWKVGKI